MISKVLAFTLALFLTLGLMPLSALAANSAPFTLDQPPTNLTVELKRDQNDRICYDIKMDVPQSVLALVDILGNDPQHFPGFTCLTPIIKIEHKTGNNDWKETSFAFAADYFEGGNVYAYYPAEVEDAQGGVNVKAEVNSFRAYFYSHQNFKDITSPYSNIVTLGNQAEYIKASDWAKPALDEANEKGLIPKSLIGADMTKPITREEFAELAVILYEKTTGTAAQAASPNPFTDTTNPEILKAYKLEIAKGISDTKFAPNDLTNREQVATMLSRAIRKMVPNGDFSIAGAPTFTDEKDISPWALEHVKYMSKLGVIQGADGKFMPKAATTAQAAAGYGTTTREQAIAMSLRSYKAVS